MSIIPILYEDDCVKMIDQRLLPTQEVWLEYRDYRSVAEAIVTMVIRGAPAIGIAAAYGAALGAREIEASDFSDFTRKFQPICEELAATRPTAVNLFWALDRMKDCACSHQFLPLPDLKHRLLQEAHEIAREDLAMNEAMGKHGATLFPEEGTILTHCNAGALATGGYGTALGVVRAAVEMGKKIAVYADETRPFNQGSRLTAWELQRDAIPVTLICDNMAGALMAKGEIDGVIVGADRIAANGDVANKIGTYTVAVLAREHNIPFYVAVPTSTIDLSLADGSQIPIEERAEREVTHTGDIQLAPSGIAVRNPAFDVTPNRLVTAIITEKGVVQGDYANGLKALFD